MAELNLLFTMRTPTIVFSTGDQVIMNVITEKLSSRMRAVLELCYFQ
jgi:hypothetical protein